MKTTKETNNSKEITLNAGIVSISVFKTPKKRGRKPKIDGQKAVIEYREAIRNFYEFQNNSMNMMKQYNKLMSEYISKAHHKQAASLCSERLNTISVNMKEIHSFMSQALRYSVLEKKEAYERSNYFVVLPDDIAKEVQVV